MRPLSHDPQFDEQLAGLDKRALAEPLERAAGEYFRPEMVDNYRSHTGLSSTTLYAVEKATQRAVGQVQLKVNPLDRNGEVSAHHLFVDPEYRRRGIASALLQAVGDVSIPNWHVTARFNTLEPLISEDTIAGLSRRRPTVAASQIPQPINNLGAYFTPTRKYTNATEAVGGAPGGQVTLHEYIAQFYPVDSTILYAGEQVLPEDFELRMKIGDLHFPGPRRLSGVLEHCLGGKEIVKGKCFGAETTIYRHRDGSYVVSLLGRGFDHSHQGTAAELYTIFQDSYARSGIDEQRLASAVGSRDFVQYPNLGVDVALESFESSAHALATRELLDEIFEGRGDESVIDANTYEYELLRQSDDTRCIHARLKESGGDFIRAFTFDRDGYTDSHHVSFNPRSGGRRVVLDVMRENEHNQHWLRRIIAELK